MSEEIDKGPSLLEQVKRRIDELMPVEEWDGTVDDPEHIRIIFFQEQEGERLFGLVKAKLFNEIMRGKGMNPTKAWTRVRDTEEYELAERYYHNVKLQADTMRFMGPHIKTVWNDQWQGWERYPDIRQGAE